MASAFVRVFALSFFVCMIAQCAAQPATPPVPARDVLEQEFLPAATRRAQFPSDAFGFDFSKFASFDIPAGKLAEYILDTAPVTAGLPGNGLGQALLTLAPCTLLQMHIHPRGSELTFVTSGTLTTAFVEENLGRLVVVNSTAGQNSLVPQGLLHYNSNPTCDNTTIVATLDNRDYGVTTIWPNALRFPDEVLLTTFGVDSATLANLKRSMPTPGPFIRSRACMLACGLANN